MSQPGVADAKSVDDYVRGILIPCSRLPGTDDNKQNQRKELGTSKNISEDISIMYTNADGLVNKRQELKALINSV